MVRITAVTQWQAELGASLRLATPLQLVQVLARWLRTAQGLRMA